MQAVLNVLSPGARKMLLISLNILSIAVFSYLLPHSWEFAIDQFAKISPALAIPKGYISIAVPIGFFLLIINLIVDTVKMIKMAPEEISISESH
jgi:TRAP-type C4-dicarboxylate transport system permease small subunit